MSEPSEGKKSAPRPEDEAQGGDESRHSSARKRRSSDGKRRAQALTGDIPRALAVKTRRKGKQVLNRAAEVAKPARHADGVPLRHLADAPMPNPPWHPGKNPARPGRPKERTFEEDARDVLNHGVPVKLRAAVAVRTGLPLDMCAILSLRQAVILLLITDAVEKGQLDKLDRVLDRTDPKSRRVEHRGNVGHLHALAGSVLNMTEADAAEVYRQMVQGPGAVIDVKATEAD